MNNYFVFSTKGTQEGPFSHDELEQLVKNGTYGAGSQVRQGEENGWEPIEKHFPLPQTYNSAAPKKGFKISKITWAVISPFLLLGSWIAKHPHAVRAGLNNHNKEYHEYRPVPKPQQRPVPLPPRLQPMSNSNSQYGNYNNN